MHFACGSGAMGCAGSWTAHGGAHPHVLMGPSVAFRRSCCCPQQQHVQSMRPAAAAVPPPRRVSRVSCSSAAASETAKAPRANLPTPVVKIDNTRDPFATVVSVRFGNELGDLLDTIAALKNLGLNIRRAKLDRNDPSSKHRFYITDATTSEKIVKSDRLEQIRLTILENLTLYHPETSALLSFGRGVRVADSRDLTAPLGPGRRIAVDTTIEISETPNGAGSKVCIITRDRPGLLVHIVSVLKDLNVNVVSAEVDTVGTQARDEFMVMYHGEPLSSSMQELVRNAMQYYLSLAEIEREESY